MVKVLFASTSNLYSVVMPLKGSGKRKVASQSAVAHPAKRINSSDGTAGVYQKVDVEKITVVSQPEMVELSYEYTLTGPCLLPQKTGEFILSKIFHAKSHPDIQWQLVIFPNGQSAEKDKGHLSLFIMRVYVNEEEDQSIFPVDLTFTALRNGEELKTSSNKGIILLSPDKMKGLFKFLNRDDMKSEDGQSSSELKIICTLIYAAKRNWITTYARTVENIASSLSNKQQVMELDNYEWIIEEPSFLPQKNGESFYSPYFSTKTKPNILWRLKMCIRGAYEESKDHLSLYLEKFTSSIDQSCTVKSNWLVAKNGKEIFSKSEEQHTLGLFPLSNYIGWDKVVPLTSIKRASFDDQPAGNDKLKISIQLIYTI